MTTLTILLVVSWALVLVGLLWIERMDRRLAAMAVLQEQLLHAQRAVLAHLGIQPQPDELTQRVRQLVADGKTYEALALYRTVKGTSYKEAKAFVDSLRNA
ncbi:MAG: hypothetical protein K6T31_02465 [Alicyclobacillus sp.]|nr:hypothetical protein [Alicyclobacillus sp.]